MRISGRLPKIEKGSKLDALVEKDIERHDEEKRKSGQDVQIAKTSYPKKTNGFI